MGSVIDIRTADGGRCTGYLAVPAAGKGPGIVLCQEIFGVNATMRAVADLYAEEGYVVLVPDLFWRQEAGVEMGYSEADVKRAFALYEGFDVDQGVQDVAAALAALRSRSECVGGTGVLGFCLGGTLAYLAACRLDDVACAVGYYGVGIEQRLDELSHLRGRLVLHVAAEDGYCPPAAQRAITAATANRPGMEVFVYPGCGHAFARVGGEHFDRPAANLAHDRSITAFRRAMGPHYELSALWDRHCECEFATRDVVSTMATMVAEPYVNHIPTMTGGVGHEHLRRFYEHHFINGNPPDTALVPVSRTVGTTQVVDEILFSFTHTCEIDWMLPGIPPTGRRVEIPLVAVVKFRGDKLCHEHIYWDQASVLVQIGLLDPAGLPVAGVETARKLLDETLPSNTLMARWRESAGK